MCRRLVVAAVERKREQVSVKFSQKAAVDAERLARFVAQEAASGAQFTPAGVLKFALKTPQPEQALERVRALLLDLAGEPPLA